MAHFVPEHCAALWHLYLDVFRELQIYTICPSILDAVKLSILTSEKRTSQTDTQMDGQTWCSA